MSDQYVGEIRAVGYNFAPLGWALCNGQLLAISSNTALFSLIGTYYGGDGRSTFALPNLQGMCPLHAGQGPGLSYISLGESGGDAAVTLQTQQMAAHPHGIGVVDSAGGQNTPALAALAEARVGRVASLQYGPGTTQVPMNPSMLAVTGGNQAHNNMPPYLVVNFIIALQGIYPPRS
jgi:microcystin-dependent protein